MSAQPATAARLRGIAAGLLTAALAVAAHRVAGHSHGTAAPGSAVLAAHALAVLAGALLIATGDRLCRAVSRVLEVAVRAVVPPVPTKPFVIAFADHPQRSAVLLAASVSHQGPPVSLAR